MGPAAITKDKMQPRIYWILISTAVILAGCNAATEVRAHTLVVFFLPSVTPSTIVRSPIPSYLVVARPLLSRDDISSAKSVERAFQRVLKRNTLRLRESLLRPSFLFLRNDSTYSIFPSWIYIYIRRTRR